jgi:L-alanine-DL-glutamate epimerase-like enolase superfamily enzyme
MIAIDIALWDLNAKLLDVSLSALLGRVRDRVAIYGIGGFTSYSDEQLQRQFAGRVECDGCSWVNMKIGGDPSRIKIAHATIGDRGFFVDAMARLQRKPRWPWSNCCPSTRSSGSKNRFRQTISTGSI